jgi:hypothetical protein
MTEESLAISKSFRRVAGLLWDAALAARERGEISPFALRRIEVEVYQPLLAHALDIVTRDALSSQPEIQGLVVQVKGATSDLEKGLKKAERVADLAAFGFRLVGAAASVVSFVMAPSAASAMGAVNAIAAAAKSIVS